MTEQSEGAYQTDQSQLEQFDRDVEQEQKEAARQKQVDLQVARMLSRGLPYEDWDVKYLGRQFEAEYEIARKKNDRHGHGGMRGFQWHRSSVVEVGPPGTEIVFHYGPLPLTITQNTYVFDEKIFEAMAMAWIAAKRAGYNPPGRDTSGDPKVHFQQTTWWKTAQGIEMRIDDMEKSHAQNTVNFLERQAGHMAYRLLRLETDSIVSFATAFPPGDLAEDAMHAELDELGEESVLASKRELPRERCLELLKETALYKALAYRAGFSTERPNPTIYDRPSKGATTP